MTRMDAGAVLFDMDGTLVDSTVAVERIWRRFTERFALDHARVMAQSHGIRMIDTIRRFAPDGVDPLEVEIDLAQVELSEVEGTREVPGAARLLASLAGVPVALVTSASAPLARARMAAAGLPMPAVLVTAEDVPHGKPHPAPYLLAAERLGVEPADCVVFEDAPAGVQAGLAAGARVVIVGTAHADERLHTIADYTAVTAEASGGRVVLGL